MKREVTILQAMDDLQLFAPWFRGNSWNPWRTFLAALFGLPMTDEQMELFRQFTGRVTVPSFPFREARLLCGRRAGKSLIAALIAIYLAVFRDYGPFLAPGELATMMIIAADRRQARVIVRYTKAFLHEIPMLASMILRETRETVELTNRVILEVHTASFRTIRGYSCGLCANDEECYWAADEDSAEPASEIVAAERPSLITIPFSILLSLSSPHARRGPMWDSFREHYGKDDSPILFWKAPTIAMNPNVDRTVIDRAYADDPVAAASEYGAEFRSDLEAFVSREAVEACVLSRRIELPRMLSTYYTGFCDPSGGSADSMTLAISHKSKDGIAVLDLLREVRPPFSPDNVVKDFATVLKSYGISDVTGDNYAGEWPKERFQVHGIVYKPSEKSRSEIYLEFLPMLNSQRTKLLDNKKLIAQLVGLERRTSRSGRESIDHSPGGHDDLANAAAGALTLVGGASSSGFACLAVGTRTGVSFWSSK